MTEHLSKTLAEYIVNCLKNRGIAVPGGLENDIADILKPGKVRQEPLEKVARNCGAIPPLPEPAPVTAAAILDAASQHLQTRGKLRDKPEGERSMLATVTAFNALTGHTLSERDGWLFMVTVKAARACATPTGIPDDYQDGAAYFALAGESAA